MSAAHWANSFWSISGQVPTRQQTFPPGCHIGIIARWAHRACAIRHSHFTAQRSHIHSLPSRALARISVHGTIELHSGFSRGPSSNGGEYLFIQPVEALFYPPKIFVVQGAELRGQ